MTSSEYFLPEGLSFRTMCKLKAPAFAGAASRRQADNQTITNLQFPITAPHPSPLPLPTGRQALGRGWG